MVSLSPEQRLALQSGRGCPITIRDDETNAVYVLVDEQMHQRAMAALRQQRDLDAISAGVRDLEEGRTMTLDELDERMHEEFGFPPRRS